MLRNIKLSTKLVTIGIALTAIPLAGVALYSLNQGRMTSDVAEAGATRMAYENLDAIVTGIYAMCESQHELLEQSVRANLNVVRDQLHRAGLWMPAHSTCWTYIDALLAQGAEHHFVLPVAPTGVDPQPGEVCAVFSAIVTGDASHHA